MLVAMLGSNCLSLSGQIKNSKKFGFLVCTGEREAVCWVKEELSRKKKYEKKATYCLFLFVLIVLYGHHFTQQGNKTQCLLLSRSFKLNH